MKTDFELVMEELEKLSSERTKKIYIGQGAKEPLFGVATGAMKPLDKKYHGNQELANKLYASGNYDAMYLAGVIANVETMSKDNFDKWMESAYFHMISDYIVAVTLAETSFAQEVADRWIKTEKELYMSAGFSCYCWLLGNQSDDVFDTVKLSKMLDEVKANIHSAPNRARYAMNSFVAAVGVSYLPLHEKAYEVAQEIGEIDVYRDDKKLKVSSAENEIKKAIDKNRIGFKRKNVRC